MTQRMSGEGDSPHLALRNTDGQSPTTTQKILYETLITAQR
jgi:hypothetical protein